ncbi:MAG: addiction module protein, partial [Polaromonas sp.]|nr:addiction module protein [Polaromonas sp.]
MVELPQAEKGLRSIKPAKNSRFQVCFRATDQYIRAQSAIKKIANGINLRLAKALHKALSLGTCSEIADFGLDPHTTPLTLGYPNDVNAAALNFRALPVSERIELAQDIWDSIVEETPNQFQLTPDEREALHQRLTDHRA